MEDIKSMFYATDKDIFDLIMSNRKKLPDHLLIEILHDMGIVVSAEDSRLDLAEYISSMVHDYYFTTLILEQTERSQRAEKNTSLVLEAEIDIDAITKGIEELKRERESIYSEIYSPRIESSTSATVPVHYTEMDYSKTRLMQKRDKRAEIQIEIEDGKVVLRGPANEKAGEILQNLCRTIEKNIKAPLPQKRIELAGVTDPKIRSNFFLKLIDNLSGFKTLDVTSIKVDRDLAYNQYDEEEEDSEAKEEVIGQVKRAMLDGEGLLYSKEFKRFSDSGFFISRIEWIASPKTGVNPRYEFEAALDNPIDGTGFKYAVKGMFKPRGVNYSVTRFPVPDADKKGLLSLLEKAAWEALAKLTKQS